MVKVPRTRIIAGPDPRIPSHTIRIMRPEREGLGRIADEVGMVIGNAEVVNLRVAARRADGADRDTRARVQAGDCLRVRAYFRLNF